jgi:hypothetical protein
MLYYFFMLIGVSSMSEFHMIIVDVVIFIILELIIKILPNYSTIQNLVVGNFLRQL